jgi:hypothetical protein
MTENYPDLTAFAFRRDAHDDPVQGFNRDKQIGLCARQLEVLRDDMGPRWWSLNESGMSPSSGLQEVKHMVKHLIRHSSESVNFYATVDFITQETFSILQRLKQEHKHGSALVSHLQQWGEFTHEHMVPGEVVFRLITELRTGFNDGRLAPLLGPLSFRALVAGTKRRRKTDAVPKPTEASLLDGPYQSSLPDPSAINGMCGLRREQIPLQFYPLLRYDAVGLLPKLIPVSPRAKLLLPEYLRFKRSPEGVLYGSEARDLSLMVCGVMPN